MNTESNVALKSTGQRVFPLMEEGRYTFVRIPAEFSWHNDRFETVRSENLMKVKSAVI